MKLYFFKSIFDNIVTEEASLDLPWNELCEMFSEHQVAETKEDVPLFIAASFNTKSGYTPVNNGTAPARMSVNVQTINCIVLDYDGGANMADTITSLDGIKHLGYTSYSHLKDGATEKFRVVIPLSEPCPIGEWNQRKHDILNLFPGTDESTINISRAFYIPSCPANLEPHKFVWNLDGDLFDWHVLEAKPVQPEPTPIDLSGLVDDGVGPVVWETFDMVQFFKDSGLYISSASHGKHNVVCPNRQHKDGGTVIWQDGVHPARFYCAHAKCQGFDLGRYFKEKTGGYQWKSKYCKREAAKSIESVASAVAQFKKNKKKETTHV